MGGVGKVGSGVTWGSAGAGGTVSGAETILVDAGVRFTSKLVATKSLGGDCVSVGDSVEVAAVVFGALDELIIFFEFCGFFKE